MWYFMKCVSMNHLWLRAEGIWVNGFEFDLLNDTIHVNK